MAMNRITIPKSSIFTIMINFNVAKIV